MERQFQLKGFLLPGDRHDCDGIPSPAQARPDEDRTAKMKKERLQRIGRFQVKIRLGRGGMGTVYLCHDSRLERFVAVKVLHEELCADQACRELFLNEARALATVSDPHVVHIYEVEPGETPYFAMEYVEGRTVLELIRGNGRFAVSEAVRIISQASEGLKAMHARGVVHRDITPSNIIIDRSGTAKLLDFGLVHEGGSADETGLVLGTAPYMAPEQVEAGRMIDLRADIYGLGATLYHMLTGEAPYAGSGVQKVAAAKLAGEPLSLAEKCPHLSRGYTAVINRMLAASPEDRFQDCEEVLQSLNKAGSARRRRTLALSLLLALFLAAVAGSVFFLLFAPGAGAGTGSIGMLYERKGKLAIDFTRSGMERYRFSHFVQSVEKGGRLPRVTHRGLHFPRGDYDVFLPPVHTGRIRLSGVKVVPARGQLRISFGHPVFLYRSIACYFSPMGREIRFQAIRAGKVVKEKAFHVDRELRSAFGSGLDLEFAFTQSGGFEIRLFPQGRAPSLYTVEGGFSEENWRDGVLRLTMSSFPQPYELYLEGVAFTGTINKSCVAQWIAGNDSWRRLW